MRLRSGGANRHIRQRLQTLPKTGAVLRAPLYCGKYGEMAVFVSGKGRVCILLGHEA